MKDLGCGMTIDKDKAAATAQHKGQTYYFCAPGCKKQFETNPERYVAGSAKPGSAH